MTKTRCEFCDFEKDYTERKDGDNIFISLDDRKEMVVRCDWGGTSWGWFKINFCPFCGRDLKEE